MTQETIDARLQQVQSRIQAAAARAGRDPATITLLAVSKKQPLAAIAAAHGAGQRAFGESYVQEALDKISALEAPGIEWHFIGRVQSNKTRQIAAHFDWVHGLCSPDHARRLNDQRPAGAAPLNVCLQVNLAGEASKAGLVPEQVAELLALCQTLPALRVRGLMTLPPPAEDEAVQRAPFRALRQLRDALATPATPLECLSMGMSGDLEAAILEGSTLVRVGTAVFGPRPYN
ncbi:YggS family pyridoxal phosphate-dependent enzyme [Marichromatium bheemlicum]|uniref:Pyridoxal phosphate homeostasis protein n=1 Tax=Marichromatium bheemlicum TaxID=365339 RepID=A0ABX1I9G1_9GAMM|nr:YggS family pyridoxal phosphate-dependent enzyme [Marichromatium bheemlicum]NKN32980.1 YggS family pyridoxal phosphate-dependent enzyme [Marichromatium bheemlicum]